MFSGVIDILFLNCKNILFENKVRVPPIKTNSSRANDDWTEPLEEEILFFLAPTQIRVHLRISFN